MKKSLTIRLVKVFFGLFILALGIVLAYQSNLGLSPWDVLHDGVTNYLPITIGQATIIVGVAILLIDILMKERIGFATFFNMLMVGIFVDLILALGFVPSFREVSGMSNLAPRLFMLLSSPIPTAFGLYFYMSPMLGAGPRDTLMCAVTKRSRFPVGINRLFIEGFALIFGLILGGSVGIGTVALVLLNGPAMQFLFKIMKFDVKKIQNETIADTLKAMRPKKHTP